MCLTTGAIALNAQEIIASQGGHSVLSKTAISWTIGEPVIEGLQSTNRLVTTGFHQSLLPLKPLHSIQLKPYITESAENLRTSTVYPNPFINEINVQLNNVTTEPLSVLLFDAYGRQIAERVMPVGSHLIKIDGAHLPASTYFLYIVRDGKDDGRMIEIVKIH